MMKPLLNALVLAAMISTSVALLAAAAERGQKKAPADPAAQRIQRLVGELSLTDVQKARMADLEKQYGPQLAEALKRVADLDRELRTNVMAALTAEQKQQLRNRQGKGSPVTGMVVYRGAPVGSATITFQLPGQGDPVVLATDESGRFAGHLKPGLYRVGIRLVSEGRSVLPAKYDIGTSGLMVQVTSGPNEFSFNLQ